MPVQEECLCLMEPTQGKAHWGTKEKRLVTNHPNFSLIKFILNDIKNHY